MTEARPPPDRRPPLSDSAAAAGDQVGPVLKGKLHSSPSR
ncbi:hypothetical protein BZL29_4710 [Mycobacterium kansasii]|uniref:Uncharacterized protein n=1 Tax=Mycobacterium kansasii TaxID=1768 RepID=A0A1V3X6K9_MYCKA|nr:hypothetical protein BZL29_4710 [Mycobacterium kansasii]